MPAKAISEPANNAAVPGSTALINWPAISASSVSTTVACEPSRAASTGAARPSTAKAMVGSESSRPVVAAGRPVASRNSGMTAPSAFTTGRRLIANSRTATVTKTRDCAGAGVLTPGG